MAPNIGSVMSVAPVIAIQPETTSTPGKAATVAVTAVDVSTANTSPSSSTKAFSSRATVLSMLTTSPSTRHGFENAYIIGARGFFTLLSFLWFFLTVFAPATVPHSGNSYSPAPSYQVILRKTVGVLFWNDGIIYSAFILLSARTICLPFLRDGSSTNIAGPVFRRGLRLGLPVLVILGISTAILMKGGANYVDDYANATKNWSIVAPYLLSTPLIFFNAVFDMFWVTANFPDQAGNLAFPSQTLWVLTVIYMQSFTVYMAMVTIPYTRASWRLRASILFIAMAWWVQSWAWYTISGLLFADIVTNMDFRAASRRGIPIYRSLRLPSWTAYLALFASGWILQYLLSAWRPDLYYEELRIHGGLYYTGGLDEKFDVRQPQARDDNYLVLMGFMFFLETSEPMQKIFESRLLVYLGNRSLSWFLVQALVVYIPGIRLYQVLARDVVSETVCALICFLVCLPVTALSTEIFYRIVEVPSHVFSHLLFKWMQK